MPQRFEAEELDRETLDYLHRVVEDEGRGVPGLYFDARDALMGRAQMPLWGLVAGPIVVLLTLLVTWDSQRDPVPVALLMTAGLFLGFWLMAAWLRLFLASQRETYVGHFKYVDPRYVWHGTGSGVEVEPLDLLIGAEAIGSRVRIDRADGNIFLQLRSPTLAQEAEEYLLALREQVAADPAERGYAALARIRDEDPREEGRIESIPTPRRAHASRGWITLLVLLACGGLLFIGCLHLATVRRDDMLFEAVKDEDPSYLRMYLIDPRNTRHRDAAVERLGRYHNEAADKLKQRKGGDPQLLAGMAAAVGELKKDAHPVITVSFARAEKGANAPESYLSPGVLTALEQKFVFDLRQTIQPLTRVQAPLQATVRGPIPTQSAADLVDFALVVDGSALLTVEAKVYPATKDNRDCRIAWTLTFQVESDAPRHVATFETRRFQSGDDPTPAVRALYGNLGNEIRTRLGS